MTHSRFARARLLTARPFLARNHLVTPPFVQKLFLAYGDLHRYPESQVKRLYRFIGVDPRQTIPVNATLKMSTAKKLADEIENLSEVEEALRGTKWHKNLYDLDRGTLLEPEHGSSRIDR